MHQQEGRRRARSICGSPGCHSVIMKKIPASESSPRSGRCGGRHRQEGGRGPLQQKSLSIYQREGQPLDIFALREGQFVRKPSGRRWSAPVSEQRNEPPRLASLTASSILTSCASQIEVGPSISSPPRSSGNMETQIQTFSSKREPAP